ncbi:hypothetical protein CONLIGDRAFT_682141 [Coniochaeta ligniaria NRRL 30616]|uniref:Uncharacterized protein n=1 Tax=Coniochaeta ligniaria NRRL 30616 TaxID=1408157 RepID=A0A1J7JIZ9_9PEZI|nr:hypothetical protein CONLIGDRAFT_682141 [Coniochaeta ligniaria NRRL 30616]
MSPLPAVKRQKREVYSKDWLLAQLFHYDLFNTYNQYRHDTQSTEKTLTNMLLMAIENGLCDHVPERILKIELELRRKVDSEFANKMAQEALYKAAQKTAPPKSTVDNYAQDEEEDEAEEEEDEENEDDEEESVVEVADPWAELHETPGAQATLDPDRFFRHYFLTDGNPNRKKTTRGLRLDGLFQDWDTVIHRAERYGLYKWMTKEKPIRVCLGWNLQKVQKMAEFTDKKVRERRVQTRTREETRLKKLHDDLVAQCQEKCKGKEDPTEWEIAGKYMVMANELLDHCSPDRPFTLHISDKIKQSDVGPGCRAAYDFAIISGSMLLATSSGIMDWLLADAEKEYRASLADNDRDPSSVSRKRKEPPTQAQLYHRSKRDLQTLRPHQKSLNYEVRIRGHEIVGDDTRAFDQPRSGHIRFKDETLMSFSGKINLGESLGLVNIHGLKYSLEAPKKTPKWSSYTEEAAARERETRSAEEAAAKQSKKAKRPSVYEDFATPKRCSDKLARLSSKKKKD